MTEGAKERTQKIRGVWKAKRYEAKRGSSGRQSKRRTREGLAPSLTPSSKKTAEMDVPVDDITNPGA